MTLKNGRTALVVAGTIAALAAALVVKGKTRKAEKENPPQGDFIFVQGVKLHYVDRGMGQPVVLLHGNGTMAQDFELSGVLDLLAARYRVIAFDRPGYGYSTRPRRRVWTPEAQARVFQEALARLGVEKPVVVGHSWGTLVALALAQLYPAQVKSLVLVSGYYFPSVRLDVPVLSAPAIPVIGDLMRYTVSPLLGALAWPVLAKRMFGPAPIPRRFYSFPKWLSLRPGQLRASAAEAAMLIPAAALCSARYAQMSTPAILLAGGSDQVISAQQSRRLHDKLPGSELRIVPATGHMFHYLWPRKVVAAVDQAAMATLPAAPRGPESRPR